MSDEIRERKAIVTQRSRAERAERNEMLAGHRRCFWTWPFGHRWLWGLSAFTKTCEVCGVVRSS